MNTKHTPAPWGVKSKHTINWFECSIIDSKGRVICDLTSKNYEANAKLIAAAPELLEACMRLSEWNDKYPPNRVYSYDRAKTIEEAITEIAQLAKQAITKATHP